MKYNLPKRLVLHMLVNQAIDSCVGVVPLLGDIFDIGEHQGWLKPLGCVCRCVVCGCAVSNVYVRVCHVLVCMCWRAVHSVYRSVLCVLVCLGLCVCLV